MSAAPRARDPRASRRRGLIATIAALASVPSCALADSAPTRPAPLTESEWRRYVDFPPYAQPKWAREQQQHGTTSSAHLLMQRAAEMHQQGELDKTVQILKSVLQKAGQEYHGEAYAALSKVLHDQGKHDLAERAMTKATRIYNEGLAQWTLM